MNSLKRKKNTDEHDFQKKTKKQKRSATDANVEMPKAEFLDIQNLREGMLILGCIIEIRSDKVLVSLPGCLIGTISITNVSKPYTKLLKEVSENEEAGEVTLKQLFEIGAVYPCKIIKVIRYETKKPTILLSIDPQAVNGSLNLQSLYDQMVLYAAVVSIEDHGYVMDLGIKDTKGFLPFNSAASQNLLNVGQVIPTILKEAPTVKEKGCALMLTGLSFEDLFPEISEYNVNLTSILPGARVSADISEVTPQFVYMKCLNYDACSISISAYKSKKVKEGETVTGRVLYVHPVTHLIYIHFGSLPTPCSFDNFFKLKKYDKIKQLKFHAMQHHKLYFKYQNILGYIKHSDVGEKTSLSHESLMKNPILPRARVVCLHYMDNLVQLTFKESQIKMKIVRLEDVKIGDIFEGIVSKHVESGMFLSICPGLSGFVRHEFLSDAYITMPEKLYPVSQNVKCRVLYIHPTLGLNLTSKESLLSMENEDLLKSYEEAIPGNVYKGVIVKITDDYIVILFFNNVRGIASSAFFPQTSVFFVGQTVLCSVLSCNPLKKKLKLTLDCEIQNFKKREQLEISQMSSGSLDDEEEEMELPVENKTEKDPIISKAVMIPKFDKGKTYNAFIETIKANQLNIVVEGVPKGRVHITQIGCSEYGVQPLKDFKVGNRLKVYVLQEFKRCKKNFLMITHQNTSTFLECSLVKPSKSLCNKEIKINKPMIGFVKKIFAGFAAISLTPNQTGLLDYVDISECPKELRKLKKTLKIGQSIHVSAISIDETTKDDQYTKMKLTTPSVSGPKAGKNVVGFVTIASIDRGLVLKLPHNYTGFVCVTDILDVYIPLEHVLKKLLKLKFVLCNVIDVNHKKKICTLSLRKSRVHNQSSENIANFSPEITVNSVQQKKGEKVKGYITAISKTRIIVNIGRKVKGKVALHNCAKLECVKCSKVSDILKENEAGDVIEVIVGDTSTDELIPLSLPDASISEPDEDTSLYVKEDINWDDLQ